MEAAGDSLPEELEPVVRSMFLHFFVPICAFFPLCLRRLVPWRYLVPRVLHKTKNPGRNAGQFPVGIEPGEHDRTTVGFDGSNKKGFIFSS